MQSLEVCKDRVAGPLTAFAEGWSLETAKVAKALKQPDRHRTFVLSDVPQLNTMSLIVTGNMTQVAVSLGDAHAQGILRSPFQAPPDALIHFVCAG